MAPKKTTLTFEDQFRLAENAEARHELLLSNIRIAIGLDPGKRTKCFKLTFAKWDSVRELETVVKTLGHDGDKQYLDEIMVSLLRERICQIQSLVTALEADFEAILSRLQTSVSQTQEAACVEDPIPVEADVIVDHDLPPTQLQSDSPPLRGACLYQWNVPMAQTFDEDNGDCGAMKDQGAQTLLTFAFHEETGEETGKETGEETGKETEKASLRLVEEVPSAEEGLHCKKRHKRAVLQARDEWSPIQMRAKETSERSSLIQTSPITFLGRNPADAVELGGESKAETFTKIHYKPTRPSQDPLLEFVKLRDAKMQTCEPPPATPSPHLPIEPPTTDFQTGLSQDFNHPASPSLPSAEYRSPDFTATVDSSDCFDEEPPPMLLEDFDTSAFVYEDDRDRDAHTKEEEVRVPFILSEETREVSAETREVRAETREGCGGVKQRSSRETAENEETRDMKSEGQNVESSCEGEKFRFLNVDWMMINDDTLLRLLAEHMGIGAAKSVSLNVVKRELTKVQEYFKKALDYNGT